MVPLMATSNHRAHHPMLGIILRFAVVSATALTACVLCAGQTETVTSLHDFTNGADGGNPYATVVADHNGVLYGTTWFGGLSTCGGGAGCGTIFKVTPPVTPGGEWIFSALYDFTGEDDGSGNASTLAVDPAGRLYGVTNGGLPNESVFRLTPPSTPGGKWKFTNIYAFQEQQGRSPWTPLLIDRHGAIYGAAPYGGLPGCGGYGCGTVVQLVPPAAEGDPWKENTLYRFSGGADGGMPSDHLVFGRDGAFYGTTSAGGIAPTRNCPHGCGVVFKLSRPRRLGDTWKQTVIYAFADKPDGASPNNLVSGKDGVLYGLACCHGNRNAPNIFALTPPAKGYGRWHKTVLHSFNPSGYPPTYLTLGRDGVLYGAIFGDLDLDAGLVFKLVPPDEPGGAWTYSTLVDFNEGGFSRNPNGVVLGKFGALYGTLNGGSSDPGAVFELK